MISPAIVNFHRQERRRIWITDNASWHQGQNSQQFHFVSSMVMEEDQGKDDLVFDSLEYIEVLFTKCCTLTNIT